MVQYLQNHNKYQNCRVLAPDGQLMFLGSHKKANWYLKRNLATLVSQDPFTVQLTFTPKGKGHSGNLYYLATKENKCVVCGAHDNLTKHHIVPYCYRRWFPNHLKSHTSYDVMLVCYSCHRKYESHASILKAELSEQNSIPFSKPEPESANAKRLRRFAFALLDHESEIPKERVAEIKKQMQQLANQEITPELIKALAKPTPTVPQTALEEEHFGKLLVEKLTDVTGFIQMWRKHFIDNTNPQHLPSNWKINADFQGY